ncbi:MAG: NUDIX domain-containing protein [Dehalococcoidia bacterium]
MLWEKNQFGGVVIDPESLSIDTNVFYTDLKQLIDDWRSDSVKLVWLKINTEFFSNIVFASQLGFLMHHAYEDYVMMTLAIEENTFIPPYSTHYIGVGGVVINDRNEILVVSEKYRSSAKPSYKLPGGALVQGEHISLAAVREVFEETGINTEFQKLSFFRHWHGYRYGKSDIYFVALLNPLDYEIHKQEEEIAECIWMDLEFFLNSPEIHDFNKRIVQSTLNSQGLQLTQIQGYGSEDLFEFFST